jgi:hypothetical protein
LVFEHIDFETDPPQSLLVDAPAVDFNGFEVIADDVLSLTEDVERVVGDEGLLGCDGSI